MVSKAQNGSTPGKDPNKPYFLPKKKTYYTKEQVAEALKRNKGFHYLTARDLDISPTCLYEYCRRWPSLKKLKRHEEKYRLNRVEDEIWKQAMAGDLTAMRYVLDRRGGKGWRKRIIKEGKLEVEHKVIPVIKAELTEEDRKKWLEEIRKQKALGHKKPLPPEPGEHPTEEAPSPSPIIIEGKVIDREDRVVHPPFPSPNPSESQVGDGSSEKPRQEPESRGGGNATDGT